MRRGSAGEDCRDGQGSGDGMNFNNHNILIADCSFYQDNDFTPQKIDFKKMKAAGISGVILRAGQNTWADEDFKDYWQAAKAAGLPRGSYWFYDSRSEPSAQADLWRSQIGDDLPELKLWADFEENYGGRWRTENDYKKFVASTQAKFPTVETGIYSANWWWHDKVQQGIIRDDAYWSEFLLWVAQYGTNQANVSVPRPWWNKQHKIVFWQFTASGDGLQYGVESKEIDLNYFNGDEAKFTQMFGGTATPPPVEEPGEIMIGKVLVNLNIRPTPGASLPAIGQLAPNDIVEASANLAGWWRLTKWTRNGVAKPLPAVDCYAYEGVSKGYIETVTQQPPASDFPAEIGVTINGVTKLYVLK